MDKDLEKNTPHDVPATDDENPFLVYGEIATARGGFGGRKLLKFDKGDFLAGQDAEEIPYGTRFQAQMNLIEIGWMRWEAGSPDYTQNQMGRLSEGYQPAKRSSLGDLDESLWEISGNTDKPRDPWQFTNHVPLLRHDDGEGYVFVTSSKGGLGAIGELIKTFGKEMRLHPNEDPIIEIDSGSYDHPDRQIGRVKFPTFKIVGWTPMIGDDGESIDPPPPSPAPTSSASAANQKATKKSGSSAQARF